MGRNARAAGRHRRTGAAGRRTGAPAATGRTAITRRKGAVAPGRRGIGAAVSEHRGIAAGTATGLCLAGAAVGGLLAFRPGAAPAAQEARAGSARSAASAGLTELATLRSAAPRSASPGGRAAGTVPASWYGYPSVLPVIGTAPGWLEVRLAQRPDGSTAWIPAADVRFSSTPYRIVVDLADTRLTLYKNGREVFSAPAGVGAPDDPTPPGQYFVAFTEPPPQPNPGYGPFILVTSDHSQAISDWEGSGDAVIGIHGPLGASLAIGTTGARISHGCIRLQVRYQLKLSGIPAGTPITITG
jgi:lipoprotein-anchoring transpeptidase ErfK/SrfK